jgi:hypothetical protein
MATIQVPPQARQQARSTAEKIVSEIVEVMKATLDGKKKKFSPGALDEWRAKLTEHVLGNLLKGGDWSKDRKEVLFVAKDMARIAAILSDKSPNVNKSRVHAAFRAVMEHARCPGGAGRGRWCDFSI